jgi:hypothetical protein
MVERSLDGGPREEGYTESDLIVWYNLWYRRLLEDTANQRSRGLY